MGMTVVVNDTEHYGDIFEDSIDVDREVVIGNSAVIPENQRLRIRE